MMLGKKRTIGRSPNLLQAQSERVMGGKVCVGWVGCGIRNGLERIQSSHRLGLRITHSPRSTPKWEQSGSRRWLSKTHTNNAHRWKQEARTHHRRERKESESRRVHRTRSSRAPLPGLSPAGVLFSAYLPAVNENRFTRQRARRRPTRDPLIGLDSQPAFEAADGRRRGRFRVVCRPATPRLVAFFVPALPISSDRCPPPLAC